MRGPWVLPKCSFTALFPDSVLIPKVRLENQRLGSCRYLKNEEVARLIWRLVFPNKN